MNRRQFLAAAGIAITAPYVLRFPREAKAQTLRIRRNLSTIPASDPFFTQYGEAISAMHRLAETDRRSWRGQALIHADFCPHGAARRPDFILWHRHYITYFERLCGELIGNPNFALPYWDWTANNGRLPAPFFANGPLNVTFWRDRSDYQADNWGPERVTTNGTRGVTATRGLRDDPRFGRAFEPNRVNAILRETNFSIFQSQLEGSPHNNGHIITGGNTGHMVDGLSPLDPIFWLHHCNVDRMAAQWQRAGNRIPEQSVNYNGQFVDAAGNPQTVTAAQALEFEAMGFTYDLLTPQMIAASGAAAKEEEPSALQGRTVTQNQTVIGQGSNAQPSRVNLTTVIPVVTRKIVDTLSATRTFRRAEPPAPAPRLAVEAGRVLARLNVSEVKGAVNQCVVNVFVNAPDLSPDVTSNSPHYAGSFSFFGQHYEHHGGTFLVDVSDALHDQAGEGRLAAEQVNIQLLPVLADPDADAKPQFVVNSVELISV